uniref:Uncharacterized protein n=1 Tax=Musa acuminata subsp. malaccensis TaxID=214687 RepID=A0A804HPF6_MUSAM|nr:PREDICTED: uncharacterized protein LOC103980886 [Musa acuminata subsp. malaccensis]
MIDTGSSADVLYFDAFRKLGLARETLETMTSALTEFTDDSISSLGVVTLPLTLGAPPRSKTVMSTFLVVDLPTAYNAILGHPTLNKIRAVVSTYHQTVKFPTHAGAGEVRGSPRESKRCYLTAVSLHKWARTKQPLGDPREMKKPTQHPELTAPTCDLPLVEDRSDRTIRIGSELPEQERRQFIGFLQENANVFAWSPSDMTGVDPKTTQHYLSIAPDARPIKQKPRRQAPDRQLAIHEEVERLLVAGFIEEVKYPRWLSNVVLVKKTNGSWRMCVDYTSLNHQNGADDQEHTTFLTDLGVYFYKVMPFGLKNAGATYQRDVNKIYGLRLNPTKCVFGVSPGKFLEFIIHERGIDANLEKVQAIIGMQTPRTIKDLQQLNGRLAALSQFLSRSGDRCLPFFRALKNPSNLQWTAKCEEAFVHVKQHLASLPRLASVSPGEKLSIYLATSRHAVSFVLTKEAPGDQLPVYYISHVLNEPKKRYPPIERLALALVLIAQKLRPYFQAHPIEVITDQLLRQVLSKFDVAGRLLKWSVELGEFDIHYVPRTIIKAQSVVDFISELAQIEDEDSEQLGEAWVLHVDGLATSSGASAGLVLSAPDGRSFERSLRFGFQATNNETEYEALLTGLGLALEMQVNAINVLTDSQLVAKQLSGRYEAREPIMAKYLAEEMLHFKRDEILPADETAARRIRRMHAWYSDVNGQLYKRSFSHPLLRCLEPEESRTVLAEVHEGICGEHIAGRTLAYKILRQGYYWPTMSRDARSYVQRCGPCQRHA